MIGLAYICLQLRIIICLSLKKFDYQHKCSYFSYAVCEVFPFPFARIRAFILTIYSISQNAQFSNWEEFLSDLLVLHISFLHGFPQFHGKQARILIMLMNRIHYSTLNCYCPHS